MTPYPWETVYKINPRNPERVFLVVAVITVLFRGGSIGLVAISTRDFVVPFVESSRIRDYLRTFIVRSNSLLTTDYIFIIFGNEWYGDGFTWDLPPNSSALSVRS